MTPSHQEKAYRKLFVWQKANDLAFLVYKATGNFPKDETYALRSQLRRAALSVPTNLVEGTARQSKKELKHYVSIALGSLAETEYLIEFSFGLGYFDASAHRQLCLARQAVGGLLWNFYRSLQPC